MFARLKLFWQRRKDQKKKPETKTPDLCDVDVEETTSNFAEFMAMRRQQGLSVPDFAPAPVRTASLDNCFGTGRSTPASRIIEDDACPPAAVPTAQWSRRGPAFETDADTGRSYNTNTGREVSDDSHRHSYSPSYSSSSDSGSSYSSSSDSSYSSCSSDSGGSSGGCD